MEERISYCYKMHAILGTVASTAIPAFLRSDMGRNLLSKVGLSPSMFSSAPSYDYAPNPYHASPSMDMYQRDYVTQGEMNYMGPSAVRHVQEAAVNTPNIHVVPRRTIKKAKKVKKGKRK